MSNKSEQVEYFVHRGSLLLGQRGSVLSGSAKSNILKADVLDDVPRAHGCLAHQMSTGGSPR